VSSIALSKDTRSRHEKKQWREVLPLSNMLLHFLLLVASTTAAPCDILKASGQPCVAAHSTTRALYDSYHGPLYSVLRIDGSMIDVETIKKGGHAKASTQDDFCGAYSDISYNKISQGKVCETTSQIQAWCEIPGGSCGPKWGDLTKCQALCNSYLSCSHIAYFEDEGCRIYSSCDSPAPYDGVQTDIFQRLGNVCIIQKIYDQSPMGNHLTPAPPGGAAQIQDVGVNAARDSILLDGHRVYGAYFEGGMGYRNDNTSGIAVGDESQTIYMVVSGTHYNDMCCFDYGNAEINNLDDGDSTMEVFSMSTVSPPSTTGPIFSTRMYIGGILWKRRWLGTWFRDWSLGNGGKMIFIIFCISICTVAVHMTLLYVLYICRTLRTVSPLVVAMDVMISSRQTCP
jgi:hypothetical protein